MPKRYRCLILAAGIALAGSLGQAQEEAQTPNDAADAEQPPAQSFPIPVPVDIVEDQAAADARERREEEADEREIEDLIGQQGMNAATQSIETATNDMRNYALYSTVLVGVGTALLFVTLFLTWQANRAAQSAVAVTRVVGQAQIRAYLSIEKFGGKVRGDHFTFALTVRNSGQSPAFFPHVVCEGQGLAGERVYTKPLSLGSTIRAGETRCLGPVEYGGFPIGMNVTGGPQLKIGIFAKDVFERGIECIEAGVHISFDGDQIVRPMDEWRLAPFVARNDSDDGIRASAWSGQYFAGRKPKSQQDG